MKVTARHASGKPQGYDAIPGTRCLQLAYINREEATDAKRWLRRQFGQVTEVVFCEICDKFHQRCETWPPSKRWREILILIARGFRRREIGKTLGLTDEAVSYAVYQMCADWHALSQAHLIAIVTSFGVIRPEEFLFLDDTVARYRQRDNRKVTYTDAV